MEFRYRINGGAEAVLLFDGRVIEWFNLFNGENRRFLHPETRIQRGEPNRNGRVTYEFVGSSQPLSAFAVEAEWVPGFDTFIAGLDGPAVQAPLG